MNTELNRILERLTTGLAPEIVAGDGPFDSESM
jgi:hypothetical protein